MAKKKAKKKRRKGQGKGGSFERKLCKELSKWWTLGKRDDVFRRSATSGGRATVRAKKGKGTFGQYGDVSIADPIGQPLLDLVTIELKTGYPGQSPFDMIDIVGTQNPKYKQFFEQCQREKNQSQVPFWILIARRKQKDIMIYLPYKLYRLIASHPFSKLAKAFPSVIFKAEVSSKRTKIFGCQFSEFLNLVEPANIYMILGNTSVSYWGVQGKNEKEKKDQQDGDNK